MFQSPSNLSVSDLRIPDSGKSTHQLTHVSLPQITFAFWGQPPCPADPRGLAGKQSTTPFPRSCLTAPLSTLEAALHARMPREDSTSILKREVCRWCGIKSKKEGCPEPNQTQGGEDREAAAGTGGLGVGGGELDAAQGARKRAGGRCMLLQPSSWGHFPAAAFQPLRSKQSQRCRCRHCTRLGNRGRLYLSMLSSH